MSNQEDYYELLGISKDASDDEIKRAYRKLALKTHPDKNGGDDTMFKKINLAYETLSDPSKKAEYDNPHEMHGFPGGDIFSQLFRGMSGMNINVNVQNNRNIKRQTHIHKINVTLKDIHVGLTKNLKLTISKTCFSCKKECNVCGGSGRTIQVTRNGPFIQQVQGICNNCKGNGLINDDNFNCIKCCGNGSITEEKTIKVEIPKCAPNGFQVVYEGLGEQAQKEREQPGDLIIQIHVEEDPYFQRENNNLIYKCQLKLAEIFLGKELLIPHFDEHFTINSNIFGIINPNKRYHVNSKGLGGSGDLIFIFEIIYPETTLDSYDREVLKNVFMNLKLI